MNDLFTSEPFTSDDYRLKRNAVMAKEHPESAADFKAQTDRILAKRLADELTNTMGIRSAPKRKGIIHESMDKLNRQNQFKEDNDVNALAVWFKKEYPGVPYHIDKIANKRGWAAANAVKKAGLRDNPDFSIRASRGAYIGLFIEAKRDEETLFYKGTRLIKPGPDNHHIFQALKHAELREQGYYVVWSISLEASRKICAAYMSGKPFNFPVYGYYCKPEDYPVFADNKFFTPCDKAGNRVEL